MKKQTILAVMALMLTACLALFAGAIPLDTAETAVLAEDSTVYVDANSVYTLPEGTVVTDIDLGNTKALYNEDAGTITGKGYAGTVVVTTEDGIITVNFRGATKWIPGLNILTGTTENYEVESKESAELTFITDKTGTKRGDFAVETDSLDASNLVIALKNSTITLYTKNDIDAIPIERPVQIVLGYNNPGYDTYCLVNGTTNRQYKSIGLTKDTAGKWENKSVGKGTPLHSTITSNNITYITSIGLQFGPGKISSDPAYIDRIAYIPYYKITYYFENGSTKDDYALYGSDAKLLTEYTIPESITDTSDGLVFVGWTDTYGGTKAVEKVSLNHRDISLFPVFKSASLIDNSEAVIPANGSCVVEVMDKNADITWTFDGGNTGASFNEETLTVTGAGYAGTVTLTATSADSSEIKVINLAGTSKWKPGLNVLNSTQKVFELSTNGTVAAEQFALMFAFDDRAYANSTIDPLNPGGYPVIRFVPASGKTYPYIYFKNAFETVIEKERPVEFKYSYHGNKSVWVNANGRNQKDIYGKAAGKEIKIEASENAWKSGTFTLTASTRQNNNDVNFFSFVGDMNANTDEAYIRKLSYIPYYKVTYMGLDGETVAATEYVLKDESGKYLTEYTLTRPVEGATSYYLDAELTQKIEDGKVALANEDIVIYSSAKKEVVYVVGEVTVTKEYTSDKVTVSKPSETDASLSDTDFIVWVDADGNKYYAGTEYAAEVLNGKTLTAYAQDMTKPAMGFAYDGNYNPSFEKAGYRYTELIEDDGRDVLHIHLWNGLDGKGETFPTDWRVSFRFNNGNNTYAHYNPAEYNIIQYSTKIASAYTIDSSNNPVARDNVNLRLYAHTAQNGTFTNPVINFNGATNIPVVDEYRVYEFDASSNADFVTKAGYGFCVDYIHNARYGGDAYIDYLRVYRKGIFNVSYDTNAPEGASVVSNVSADTNRGVGTGYMLKDERPAVEGYVFMGWAEKADATASDVVKTIDLKGDTVVYAVWEAETNYKANKNENKAEIKNFGTENGIRFYTSTNNAVKACVNELGFLVTRESFLTNPSDYTELTFDFKANNVFSAKDAPMYVSGVAYKKNTLDIIFGHNDDGDILYTAMARGIPMSAKKEKLVLRPYAKYLISGKEVTVYGEASSASLYEIAEALKNENGEAYAANKEYIDRILE